MQQPRLLRTSGEKTKSLATSLSKAWQQISKACHVQNKFKKKRKKKEKRKLGELQSSSSPSFSKILQYRKTLNPKEK